MTKIVIGNPASALRVEVDLGQDWDEDVKRKHVRSGLEDLKLAGDTWRAWSLEVETDEERAQRERNELEQRLTAQMQERRLAEMQRVLNGEDLPLGDGKRP